MLAQQRSMLVAIHSVITAPPLPCLSVALSLTSDPSHNLCPLSDHTEREAQGWRRRGSLWFSPAVYLHGIETAFLSQGFLLRVGLWPRNCPISPISSGDYHRNSVCACVYVCVSPALCLLLIVLGLAAGADHYERGSPPARVWVSAPVQKTAPQMWLLLCPCQRYVDALLFRTFILDGFCWVTSAHQV